jgi:myosin-15
MILDWQPLHSERNLVKVVGGVPARPDRYFLPHDIDHHAFTKFTNIYFKVIIQSQQFDNLN